MAVKKILLVQLFANGDCLYATAIARQIKSDFPGCFLTWAISDFCSNIINGNPYVDEILIVKDVPKNDAAAFRTFKKKVKKQKANGDWYQVFITHSADNNIALYDGTIRGMIFRAYPFPVTVPVQPVVIMSSEEKKRVAAFAGKYNLKSFSNVILWEYAPQSGQSVLEFDFVMKLAIRITKLSSTCVILSSANAFISSEKIIDASSLTIRENAALTHYCTLLIGCSSGITWLNTSSAAKFIPMVQLLNKDAFFLNAPSVDFIRFGISVENLIEIYNLKEEIIFNCICAILEKDFSEAKIKYNQKLSVSFNTTRKIVYNLLCYLQFSAVVRHYHVVVGIYGRNPKFLKEFYGAILAFPFRLIANFFRKHIMRISKIIL